MIKSSFLLGSILPNFALWDQVEGRVGTAHACQRRIGKHHCGGT
jgi:hypothetical protein